MEANKKSKKASHTKSSPQDVFENFRDPSLAAEACDGHDWCLMFAHFYQTSHFSQLHTEHTMFLNIKQVSAETMAKNMVRIPVCA